MTRCSEGDGTGPYGPAARTAGLEGLLGDPADPANPLGTAAVLAADARGELPPGGGPLLAAYGLHADLVPAALGGRLTGLETAARLLRAVFRRDLALGRACGSAPFAAALPVWCHGTPRQRDRAARVLLGGGRPAVAFAALAHGNAFSDGDLALLGGGRLLHGRSPVLANAPAAEVFVLVVRHADAPGGTHTALLLDREALPPGAVRELPPHRAAGARRIPAGRLVLDRWPVPPGAVLGRPGHGIEVMLRALQIGRPVILAAAVGCADTALRSVLTAALAGHAGARPPASRTTRAAVASAFADLLAGDCLALAALRGLHLLPGASGPWSAAAGYLVPRLLREGTGDLATVLGTGWLRDDERCGTYRKHLRDLAEVPPGHVGAAAALSALLPQLPVLARRSWTAGPGAPPELFAPGAPLPPLDPARVTPAAGHDPLPAVLIRAADDPPAAGRHGRDLRARVGVLAAEFARLRERCRALPEGDPDALADPRGHDLGERYALLAAAASCLGVWQEAARRGSGFLADPAWLVAALGRIALRLGVPVPDP
ncbi:MAG TPA: acyl-CoA dehydrogenase, partial [Streptomyces sp.]|uniref:acyl-CoA dehydrogenase n=1 Tax=Streptomyces sp. TaxID=1931 RepID=UPI002D53FC26